MNPMDNFQCPYCMEGKCYANAADSPEEYDCYQPKCTGCSKQAKTAQKK